MSPHATLTIVNPRAEYRPVALTEPPKTGYLLLGAVVAGQWGRTPFPRGGQHKTALLANLKQCAVELARLDQVTRATVYRAVLVPPVRGATLRMATRPARYDVVVLVETADLDSIQAVESSPAFRTLYQALGSAAQETFLMRAHCLKRVADVDKSRPGLFLFNYFVAKDAGIALDLWDHLAGWYAKETGLDNSTLLGPIGGGPSDYVFVNHARWDLSLPGFGSKQFGTPTFRTFVLANLRANATAAMPILYRLA